MEGHPHPLHVRGFDYRLQFKILLMFNFRAYGIRNCCKENQTNAQASLWGENPTLVAQSQGAFCHLLLLNLNPADWHLPWALLNRRLARSRSTCTLAFTLAAVTDFYCNLWVKTEAAISNANSEVPGPCVPFAHFCTFLILSHPFCPVAFIMACSNFGQQIVLSIPSWLCELCFVRSTAASLIASGVPYRPNREWHHKAQVKHGTWPHWQPL